MVPMTGQVAMAVVACVYMCVVGEGYYIYVFVRCVVERCW